MHLNLGSDDPGLHAELVADERVQDDEGRVRDVGSDGHVTCEHLFFYFIFIFYFNFKFIVF